MENPKAFLLAALFSLAPLAAGCSALRLELVDASVEKPSNVAVYFTVDTRQGEPVPVVFTDGTDRAARDAEIGLYAIGLGGEVDPEEIRRLGRDGSVHVSQNDAVVAAFEQIAEKIQGLASRFYLLSYCSPARAGAHELEVEAVRGEEKGSLSYEFDAEGFEPGCDPSTPPAFDMPGTELSGKKGARRRAARRAKKPKSAPAAEGGSKSKEIAPPPAY